METESKKGINFKLIIPAVLVVLFVIVQLVVYSSLIKNEENVVGLDKKAQNAYGTIWNKAKSAFPVLEHYADTFKEIALANARARGGLGSLMTSLSEANIKIDPDQWNRFAATMESGWTQLQGDLNEVIRVCVEIRATRRNVLYFGAVWMAGTSFDVDRYLNIPVAAQANEAWKTRELKPVDVRDK